MDKNSNHAGFPKINNSCRSCVVPELRNVLEIKLSSYKKSLNDDKTGI
jgi:hypothetical protein